MPKVGATRVLEHKSATRQSREEETARQLQHAEVPMWIFDRETLEILEVNAAAVNVYGYSREQFLRQTIVFLRPPSDASLILRKTLQPEQAAPSVNETWRHRRADGKSFPVRIDSQWISWKGRPAELVTATPVDETDIEES